MTNFNLPFYSRSNTFHSKHTHIAGHLFPVFILWVILFSLFPPHLLQFTFLPSHCTGRYRSDTSAAQKQWLITVVYFTSQMEGWEWQWSLCAWKVKIIKPLNSLCSFYYKIHTLKGFLCHVTVQKLWLYFSRLWVVILHQFLISGFKDLLFRHVDDPTWRQSKEDLSNILPHGEHVIKFILWNVW